MNQLQAMRDTVALMEERGLETAGETRTFNHILSLPPDLQPKHVREMPAVMESGVNPQDTERSFSQAKMGRWLGWAQAAVVAMGLANLDDMKAINKRNMDALESETPA